MRRSHALAATVLAAALALTGCSAAGSNTAAGDGNTAATDQTQSDSGQPAAKSVPEQSQDESDVAEDLGAADALSLKGPSESAIVPDMEPVIENAKPKFPATVTDTNGKKITVDSGDRVLSLDLYGTLTDTIIGLGLGDHLVGRASSDLQEALADLPVVTTSGHDLNIEAVLDLKPDLILTNTTIGTDRLYEQLESAGITVVRFDQVPSLDAIEDEILQVGAVFGMGDDAEELASHTETKMDEALATIDQLRSQTPIKPRGLVLYVRGTAGIFFILGKDYGAADVLDALGLEDVAAENNITNLKPANAESLVSLDPQVVLAMADGVASSGGIDGFLGRPGMKATTAGQNERIVTAPDTQLLSYGPRTPDNLVALARAIYTDSDSAGE